MNVCQVFGAFGSIRIDKYNSSHLHQLNLLTIDQTYFTIDVWNYGIMHVNVYSIYIFANTILHIIHYGPYTLRPTHEALHTTSK